MNESRLNRLFEFLKEDPNDPFIIYGIATEYLQIEPLKAKEYFEILLNQHPDYLGTYYHAAKLYVDLQELDMAKTTFEKGINLAQSKNDHKALREINAAYREWLDDLE